MRDTRVAVADQVLRDVALNKSSFQSSNRSSSYTYMAQNGNDGNLSSCMETGYEVNPWWAVDLGVPTVVHQVTFNNAGVYDSSSGTSTHFDYMLYTVSRKKVTACIHCHNSDKQCQILTAF